MIVHDKQSDSTGLELTDSCPACGSAHKADEWPTRRTDDRKKVLWCADCGFGWQNPLPTPKEIQDYYSDFPPYNLHGANEKEEGFRRRLNRINELMPRRGRLLDIGSGLGYFLKLAQRDGWDVTGVEPQESAVEYSRKFFNINPHTGLLQDQNFDAESFDVVTLWDVLEHVHNPLEFLDKCVELVAPGGLLVLAVPNASGWPARVFRGQWRYVMFTHLSYFTTAYIDALLVVRGLRIEQTHHTIKAQSLIQGFSSWLPFKIDTERLIRLGRVDSIEKDRPELWNHEGRLLQPGGRLLQEILQRFRRLVLGMNLAALPLPSGDLMEFYCRKVSKMPH